jgi:hypothetical protein
MRGPESVTPAMYVVVMGGVCEGSPNRRFDVLINAY